MNALKIDKMREKLRSLEVELELNNELEEGIKIAELKDKKIIVNPRSRDELSMIFTIGHLYGHLVQFNIKYEFIEPLIKKVSEKLPLILDDTFKKKFYEYEKEAFQIGKGLFEVSFKINEEIDSKYYIFMETDFNHYWNYLTTNKSGDIESFNKLLSQNYSKWKKNKNIIESIPLQKNICFYRKADVEVI